MLTKAVGGICIFCGALWFGFYQSSLLRRREKELFRLKTFLNLLEVEIRFSAARLPDIFRRLSVRVELSGLLEQAAELLPAEGIRSAWNKAVDSTCVFLTKEDKEVIQMLGAELGMTDRDNQIKNIQHLASLTDKQYEEAHERRQRLCRLYEGGGVLIGLFLIVLLI